METLGVLFRSLTRKTLAIFLGVSIMATNVHAACTGDVNDDGKIDIRDALLTLQYVVGVIPHNGTNDDNYRARADVCPLDMNQMPYGDSNIDIADALLVLKRAVNLFNWPTIPITTLTSQTITSAEGGTVSFSSPGYPLDGTSVSIPPNALGPASDTITIGYSDSLPGPVNAQAVAAGAVQDSKVVCLLKASNTPFNLPVQVTIPYDANTVGLNEYPVVVYWDEMLQKYQPVEIVSIDKPGGKITFKVKHFSLFTIFHIPGIYAAISDAGNSFPSGTEASDSGFRPGTDGFGVQNFSSQSDIEDIDGFCFGLTFYSAWYFEYKKKNTLLPLYGKYQPASTLIRQENDVARELIYSVFSNTKSENLNSSNTFLVPDSITLTLIVTNMIITESPQILSLNENKSIDNRGAGHSLVAFRWNANEGLYVYDPNYPAEERPLSYARGSNGNPAIFSTYGVEPRYNWIGLSSVYTSLDDAKLLSIYNSAEQGWPNKHYNSLSVVTPKPFPSAASISSYPVYTDTPQTTFTIKWQPAKLWSGTANGTTYPLPSYAHVFLNHAYYTTPVYHLGTNGNATFDIALPKDAAGKTLVVIVSNNPNSDIDLANQGPISMGYEGFLRVQLVPVTQTVSITPPNPTVTTGQTIQLTAKIYGANNQEIPTANTDYAWVPSSHVNAAGLFTAGNSAGQITVTATLKSNTSISGSTVVTVTAPPKACQDVSGSWQIYESVTITCSGSFGSGSDTQSGSGDITISQNGCNVSFLSPGNTLRSGTVTGNNIQFSGIAALVVPGVVFNQNYINFTGTISQNLQTINMTGRGAVTGSVSGVAGSCTVSSTETLTR